MAREVYECVLSGTLAGQFVQTVQHQAIDDPAGSTPFGKARELALNLTDTGGAFDLFVKSLPGNYDVTSLRVRRVSAGGGPTFILVAGAMVMDTNGARDADIVAQQVNPLIIWIPTTDPNKTGRVFIPGVDQEDCDNGVLTATIDGLYQAFAAEWIATKTISPIGDFFGCVFRRASHTGDQISAYYISPLIGTQRRRLHPV